VWLIVILSAIVFMPFAANGFFSDDWDVLSHLASGGPFGMWTHPPTSFFRPLVSSTLWVSAWAAGPWHSWAYAVPSFALNAVNAGLVFLVARALLGRSPGTDASTRNALASFAALLFMAAPSNLEAIVFISDRGDLLAGFFILSSTLAFLVAIDQRRPALAYAAAGLLALGCISKESTYAYFLFFAAVGLLERKDKESARMAWMTAGLGLAAVIVAAAVRSRVVSSVLPYGTQAHLVTEAAKGLVRLGIMLVRPDVPVDFGIVLGRSIPHLTVVDFAILAPVLLCVGLGTAKLVRTPAGAAQRPGIAVPLAAFLASGAAVCFLAIQPFSPENGRLMYPPSAFAAITFAFVLAPYFGRPAVRAGAVALVLCGTLFTFFNGVLYRSVGGDCANTLEWFETHHPGPSPAVILVPDSVGGRYIWRNGFPQALEAFAPDWAAAPFASTAYFGERKRVALLVSRYIDIGALKTGAIYRSPSLGSAVDLTDADLITVGIDGSVTEIRGLNIKLPAQGPNGR